MVASALVPIGLAAGVAYLVYTQRQPPKSSCAILTPEERRVVDYTLQTSERDLLLVAASNGINQPAVVNEINVLATATEVRGCPEDAKKLRDKAASISRQPPAPASPWPVPQAAVPLFQLPPPPAGAIGMPGEFSMAPDYGMPPASLDPAQYPPGSAAPPVGMPPPPPPQTAPAGAPMQTSSRCWIRPEPRAFDDAAGRFGFSCPAAFPITLLAFGPPALPPGWAQVELQHPDHGPVQGFVEIANLSALTAAKPSAAAKTPPNPGVTPPNGKITMPNGTKVAVPSMASAMAGMGAFQGRKRRRPQPKTSGKAKKS